MISFKIDVRKNGKTEEARKARGDVIEIARSAIEAVDPYAAVKRVLKISQNELEIQRDKFDLRNYKNIYLVGFGKASFPMAKAACESLSIDDGAVIIPAPSQSLIENIELRQGTHPIPSQINLNATNEVIEIVKNVKKQDLLVVLISGGGSALLSKPRISIKDLRVATDLLLKSGCTITELNGVRKHLSWVKGGQLASLAKSTIISLIVSDIVNDPLDAIASGPTYPDSTTFADAKAVLEKYELWVGMPPGVQNIIKEGLTGKTPETAKEETWDWNRIHNYIIANNQSACLAACRRASVLGYGAVLPPSKISGEAREVGKKIVRKMKSYKEGKVALVGGGETTVRVRGNGKGGRNQEIVLGTVEVMRDKPLVFASFGTDGIDGNTDAAGAIADGQTFERALDSHLNPEDYLKRNDSYNFFRKLEDLLITGPTNTNVMDLQILLKYK